MGFAFAAFACLSSPLCGPYRSQVCRGIFFDVSARLLVCLSRSPPVLRWFNYPQNSHSQHPVLIDCRQSATCSPHNGGSSIAWSRDRTCNHLSRIGALPLSYPSIFADFRKLSTRPWALRELDNHSCLYWQAIHAPVGVTDFFIALASLAASYPRARGRYP